MIARMSHLKPLRIAAGAFALLLGALALVGCGDSYPKDLEYGVRTDPIVLARPEKSPSDFGSPGQWPYLQPAFSDPNVYKGKLAEPSKLSSEQLSQFDKTLTALFGTPAAPKVEKISGIDDEMLRPLTLDADTLAAGSKLYRRHCLHCHGLTGDGHGPTAAWVNPHPRDYRPGIFKFTSSSQSAGTRKPRREDLLRILKRGIEGTSMPSFGLLPEDELQKLASYVTHLSIRGQCELDAMKTILSSTERVNIDETIRGLLLELVGYWSEAEVKLIDPANPPPFVPGNARPGAEQNEVAASVTRGYQQFMGATGGTSCISCHKDFGRVPNLLWDEWGTVVRPLDLTHGTYRGGRRPIDLYWRVHAGVNGAGMPAVPDNVSEQAKWDIVNFVLALPYPGMLPAEIRKEIYGPYEPVKSESTALKTD